MERSDMIEIAHKVMGYYGSLKPWSDERLLSHVAAQFAGYLPDRVKSAVDLWAKEHPDKAPKPAELLAFMRKDQAPTQKANPETCRHPRPLAIVDEDDDGARVGMCIRCTTTIVFPPGKLLTETEIETRRLARQEAH